MILIHHPQSWLQREIIMKSILIDANNIPGSNNSGLDKMIKMVNLTYFENKFYVYLFSLKQMPLSASFRFKKQLKYRQKLTGMKNWMT